MIAGCSTSVACPGPCDRCGAISTRPGDCDRCLNAKPARPLPEYAFAHTVDATGPVTWRRAA